MGDILQFEIYFKMAALTEASIALHGLLRQSLLQQRSSDCRPHDEVVQEGRRNPSTGPSPRSLVLSIIGYWLLMPCSYCSTPEHCKLIFTNLSPFPSQPPPPLAAERWLPRLPHWDAEGHPPQRSHLGAGGHSGCQGCGFQRNKNNIKTINLFQDHSLM